jgi:peroxiredoxin
LLLFWCGDVLAQAVPEPDADFTAAQAHFQRARELQQLHRNTEASARELRAALAGYQEVVSRNSEGHLAARALYMTGSASLFLDEPDQALTAYRQVIEKHQSDREYLAKALIRKASVEKNTLDTASARKTIQQYFERFPDSADSVEGKEADRIQRGLKFIGEASRPIAVSKWFNSEPLDTPALKGKVVMLYFWATWCPNCLKEVDFIKDLHKRFEGRGLRVIGITNHTRGQTDETVARYVSENGFAFPVAVDRGGESSRLFGAATVPTGVLIDRRGTVRWHDHPAALSDAVLAKLLNEARGEASRQ